jgi:hypothetical protein
MPSGRPSDKSFRRKSSPKMFIIALLTLRSAHSPLIVRQGIELERPRYHRGGRGWGRGGRGHYSHDWHSLAAWGGGGGGRGAGKGDDCGRDRDDDEQAPPHCRTRQRASLTLREGQTGLPSMAIRGQRPRGVNGGPRPDPHHLLPRGGSRRERVSGHTEASGFV